MKDLKILLEVILNSDMDKYFMNIDCTGNELIEIWSQISEMIISNYSIKDFNLLVSMLNTRFKDNSDPKLYS